MITPGLSRILHLLSPLPRPFSFQAIHISGTNGKGSICAYISRILHSHGVRVGRFTSPHLLERYDSIYISECPISPSTFHEVESRIEHYDTQHSIQASEFEKLTATAFECFTQQNVQVAVVETGMGGSFDATNVLERKEVLVTVVSKVGYDHKLYLGDTLHEIAGHKAGTCKSGVPCLVDGTNEDVVVEVVEEVAGKVGAGPVIRVPGSSSSERGDDVWDAVNKGGEEEMEMEMHQKVNISLAVMASRIALERFEVRDGRGSEKREFDLQEAVRVAKNVKWPGRLQWLSIERVTGRKEEVLLDGAHNAQSAEVLGGYIDRRIRRGLSSSSLTATAVAPERQKAGLASNSSEDQGMLQKLMTEGVTNEKKKKKKKKKKVTFVLAATRGKDLSELFMPIVRKGDQVVVVEFGPVDGMPWVEPAPTTDIIHAIRPLVSGASSPVRDTNPAVSHGGDGHDQPRQEEEGEKQEEVVVIEDAGNDVLQALGRATRLADGGPLVIAGSLYLVGDVLRLLRDTPGSSS